MQLFSYRSQKYSNDKERDREWSGWHQVTEGGQSLPRPHLPSFVQNINRETWKKHQRNIWKCQQTILPIRGIFEIVNRQCYPALFKTSTEKHEEKNIREIFKIVNRQSRYHVRFWFSLYFWPKPCQYRLYLISRFPELFICESLQSWPTDQRGPSFSYISFTFTKTKFFLLVLDFYQFTQGLKNTPILPIYWC